MSFERYNAERQAIKDYGVKTREETWRINYADRVVTKGFFEAHKVSSSFIQGNFGEADENPPSPYKACQYGRSADLCRNYLVKSGLVNAGDNTPVEAGILEVAKMYALPPTFEFESESSGDTFVYPEQAYRIIQDTKQRERVYLFLHPDEFIWFVHVYKQKTRRYLCDDRTCTDLTVYPKALLQDLYDNIYLEKMLKFLDRDIRFLAKVNYNLDLTELSESPGNWENVHEYDPLQADSSMERLERVLARSLDAARFYEAVYKDLSGLRARLLSGESIDVRRETFNRAVAFFKDNAPVYLIDKNPQARHLAELMLQGADNKRMATEWCNPKFAPKEED